MMLLQLLSLVIALTMLPLIILMYFLIIGGGMAMLGAAFLFLVFGLLVGAASSSFNAGLLVFALLYLSWVIRIYSYRRSSHGGRSLVSHIAGSVEVRRKMFFRFHIPLSPLRFIIRMVPESVFGPVKRKHGLDLSVKEIIDLVLENGRGASVEVQSGDANFYMEIR